MAIIKLIKTNSRRHESAKEHWKLTERRCYDLEMGKPGLKGTGFSPQCGKRFTPYPG